MRQIEIYLLLYRNIDLDIYKDNIIDNKYNKYLKKLLLTQDLNKFINQIYEELNLQNHRSTSISSSWPNYLFMVSQPIKKEAYLWSQNNKNYLKGKLLSILNNPFKIYTQKTENSCSYQFNRDNFEIHYPLKKNNLPQSILKILKIKYNQIIIKNILKQFNVSYLQEGKWTEQQWDAVQDSCEGFRDALNISQFLLEKQHKQIIKINQSNLKSDEKQQKLREFIRKLEQFEIYSNKQPFKNYFKKIQLSFTENNPQVQSNLSQKQKQQNVKVSVQHSDDNQFAIISIEVLSCNDSLRQETCSSVLREVLNEMKHELNIPQNQSFQSKNRTKVMSMIVFPVQQNNSKPIYKFKKKTSEMNQYEVQQTMYFIYNFKHYQQIANRIKKQIKFTLQNGLKNPEITEDKKSIKVKLSSFQFINAHQLIVNDATKFIPKSGIYSIKCLKPFKTEPLNDFISNSNWEIQVLVETNQQQKYQYKNFEFQSVNLDSKKGEITFKHNDQNQSEPIIIKYLYKKEIVSAYINNTQKEQQ